MAKKKKRKPSAKARPRPGARPPRPQATPRPPAAPETSPAKEERRSAAKERREAEQRRRRAQRRRKQIRNVTVVSLIVAGIVSAIVLSQISNRRAAARYERVAATAGCDKVQNVGGLSAEHTEEAVKYKTSPPVGGNHSGKGRTPGGVFNEPFVEQVGAQGNTIFQAVHSLEHGFVIVWHNGLNPDEVAQYEKAFRGEDEVIVVPYPKLKKGKKVALTAWGRLQYCDEPSARVAEAFVKRFQNKTAPENAQT